MDLFYYKRVNIPEVGWKDYSTKNKHEKKKIIDIVIAIVVIAR